uniref:Uncharacterized protein n=1 Tax=Wuchereria bancrofti TaxID=6293 RepID=A0AAF5RTA6_WUCBA
MVVILIKKHTEMVAGEKNANSNVFECEEGNKKKNITLKVEDIFRINIFAKACCGFIKDDQLKRSGWNYKEMKKKHIEQQNYIRPPFFNSRGPDL